MRVFWSRQLIADKESLALAAPLGIAFAKHLGHLYLPPLAASTSPEGDDDGSTTAAAPVTTEHDFPSLPDSNNPNATEEEALIPREVKDKFRKLLVAYLDALGRREGKNHVVRSLPHNVDVVASRRRTELMLFVRSDHLRNYKSKTRGITKLTFARARCLKIERRTMRRA